MSRDEEGWKGALGSQIAEPLQMVGLADGWGPQEVHQSAPG